MYTLTCSYSLGYNVYVQHFINTKAKVMYEFIDTLNKQQISITEIDNVCLYDTIVPFSMIC